MNKLLMYLPIILLLSSCAPRVAIKPIPVNTPPEEIIKLASAGTENIKGLKASVKVTVQADGQTPRSIDGVLYISRPDEFRFTGLAFMGFTVFDMTLTGDKFYFYRPSEGWLYTGPREAFKGFLAKNGVQADPEVIGKALFLQKKEGEQFLVEKTDDGYDIYEAESAEGVLLPRMKAEYDAGMNLKRKIFFDGLARPYLYVTQSGKIEDGVTNGVGLPARLTVKDISQGMLLTVDFEKYLVNPEGLDKDFTIEGQELKGIRDVQ